MSYEAIEPKSELPRGSFSALLGNSGQFASFLSVHERINVGGTLYSEGYAKSIRQEKKVTVRISVRKNERKSVRIFFERHKKPSLWPGLQRGNVAK